MAAGVFLFVLASLSWTAKSQFLSKAGCQQPIPNSAPSSSCGCSTEEHFMSLPGPIRSSLSSARSQYDIISSNLESLDLQSVCGLSSHQFVSPTRPRIRPSVLSNTGAQCDSVEPNSGLLGNDCGCSSSKSQFLGPLTSVSELGCTPSPSQLPKLTKTYLISQSGSKSPQCDVPAPLGVYGIGPSGSLPNLVAPSNFPSVSVNPSFGRSCELNNYVGPIKNQVTETITTQVPSLSGTNPFVSETFVKQNPCQSCLPFIQNGCSSTSPKFGQCNSVLNFPLMCTSSAIETCSTREDEDEHISNTLANALQLLIVSNLIENLNEAAALGTLTTPLCGSEITNIPSCTVVENDPGCKNIINPIKPTVTSYSNTPSINSPLSASSFFSNPFASPRQTPCNPGLRELINPIKVTPLGSYGGVPEIINSKISSGAPNIPDIINPTNLNLAEAINSRLPFGQLPSCNINLEDKINPINLPFFVQPSVLPEIGNPVNLPAFGSRLPFGPLPSCNRNFADKINPISLPSLLQPSVLPEISNPVNLPALGSLLPNIAEGNPLSVQSNSPLAPTPGRPTYNVPYLPSLLQPSVLPEISDPVNLSTLGSLLPKIAEGNPFNVQSYSPLAPTPGMHTCNVPYLPPFVQPSVLPEIGNPVNLPALGSQLPNIAEGNPFNVQSYSPLAPTPGIHTYNVPYLPPFVQPSVLPEKGNPVNLPALGSVLPNIAEGNPFNVQSYSPLAPTPGIFTFNELYGTQVPQALSYKKNCETVVPGAFNDKQFSGPQIPESYNYNEFNGPMLPDTFNYNRFSGLLPLDAFNCNELFPEGFNYKQIYGNQANPLISLLEQLLTVKANANNAPYSMPEIFNPYMPYGAYPDQKNSFGGSYVPSFEIKNQYSSSYPFPEASVQFEAIPSQNSYGASAEILAPITSSLGQYSYTENTEATLPISLSSPSYPSEAFTQASTSSFINNGFADVLSSSSAYSNAFSDVSSLSNTFSHPEVVFVPVDIPGIPVTLSGTLPDVPLSLTPANYFCEVKDVPAQLTLETLIAELLIPSSIPAQLTVNI